MRDGSGSEVLVRSRDLGRPGVALGVVFLQNVMFPPLWALAKVFGVRPYYDRWDSRI